MLLMMIGTQIGLHGEGALAREGAVVDAPVDAATDDDVLMVRVAARDAAAFRLIVERHAVMVRRIGYRMLGDVTEAEDIAQEAMARLWQHAARWRAGGPGIAAWLHRVAVNACLDRLRKRRPVSAEGLPERVDEAPLADAVIDATAQRQAVIACVQALPDRQRAAIILTYYEGVSNMMAASALDMNIKAFESLLHRARQALKSSLIGSGAIGEDSA